MAELVYAAPGAAAAPLSEEPWSRREVLFVVVAPFAAILQFVAFATAHASLNDSVAPNLEGARGQFAGSLLIGGAALWLALAPTWRRLPRAAILIPAGLGALAGLAFMPMARDFMGPGGEIGLLILEALLGVGLLILLLAALILFLTRRTRLARGILIGSLAAQVLALGLLAAYMILNAEALYAEGQRRHAESPSLALLGVLACLAGTFAAIRRRRAA